MSVIQAKGFCWEVISSFFSGTFPCADPSTEGLGIMRRLRGCLSMLHGAWPTSLEDQNSSSNISHYRKDVGQKLHARSLLVFHTLQIVAFRFAFSFACWFFCKRVTFVPEVWEEFMAGACNDVNAVWTIRRANLVLQFGFSDLAALVFLSLGTKSPPADGGCTHTPPAVLMGDGYFQSHCRLGVF